MSTEAENLQARVDDLHERLASAQTVSPELRSHLEKLLADLERVLKPPPADSSASTTTHPEPLVHSLSQAARRFETDHPTLANALGMVADALSRVGI